MKKRCGFCDLDEETLKAFPSSCGWIDVYTIPPCQTKREEKARGCLGWAVGLACVGWVIAAILIAFIWKTLQ